MVYNRKRDPFYYNEYSGQMMHGNSFQNLWNSGLRNYPVPYSASLQNPDWHSYQPQNPYYPQQYQPMNQSYYPMNQPQPFPIQPVMQKDSQFLFKNPLQPQEEMLPPYSQYPYMPMGGGLVNPYPKPNFLPNQSGGFQSLMNSFKSQDGSVDFNKMMNTAGQMMNAVTQMTSLFKGIGGMFKP